MRLPTPSARPAAATLAAGLAMTLLAVTPAAAQSTAQAAPAQAAPAAGQKTLSEEGKWMLADGSPTYNIEGDKVDWFVHSGFRRYHSECHVCHGPEGKGSTYAPALVDSLKTMDHATFVQIVASGQQNVRFQGNSVMPALGDNKNVMCYIDDMYIYLKALSDGAFPGGRPRDRVDKTKAQNEFENACLGG